MASSGFLFRVHLLRTPTSVASPTDPVFTVAPSAYQGRALVAQIFGLEPGQIELELCPEGTRPPRDALIYRLEPGLAPLGDRWILYRG